MFNLIQLFLRLSGFFVFILLEIVCFTLVVKYNQTQKDIYVNSVNRGTGFFHKTAAELNYYFSLDDENYRLAKANARLMEQMYNKGIDTTVVSDTAFNSLREPHYTFKVAKVIKNSVNNHHNYLILDIGAKDGVKPHTGLVTNDGVVGIIRKVSNRYSVAMSVLHRQMRISARIRGKNFFGPLKWIDEENNTRYFSLEDISKDADFATGDTIETSGYSAIFPEGIMLGTIESSELKPGKNFYDIKVKSKLDMTNIQYVYVLENLFRDEIEELENAVKQDDE